MIRKLIECAIGGDDGRLRHAAHHGYLNGKLTGQQISASKT